MFSAQKAGELDLVLEMADIIDEMSDPNLIDQVLHLIPGANVYNAARINGEKAVVSAVYIHSLAADLLVSRKTEYSLMAGELLNYLPNTINFLRNSIV